MAAPNELSFLPDDYLERKGRRRANALCAALSVIVMGAIASAFYLTERSMNEVEARAAKVDAEFTEAARSIDQVNKMKAQQQKIVHQAVARRARAAQQPAGGVHELAAGGHVAAGPVAGLAGEGRGPDRRQRRTGQEEGSPRRRGRPWGARRGSRAVRRSLEADRHRRQWRARNSSQESGVSGLTPRHLEQT
jgi:hypothetical protein